MNLNIFKKRKSGLTLVVATTLLFAGPVAAHAATTGADNAADNTATNGATSASADGNNGIVGTEPGASTATGGIKIAKTTVGGRYGDKYSVNATLDIRVDYTGENVTKGATFSVGLGDGLQVPNGFNSVDLKATALDDTEKKIGKCTASGGAFNCVVTEDIAATLGGNGSLKNGFVKLEAVLTKSSVGKTNTTVVVDGTTYTVGLGKGVVGEPVTKGDGKFCWSDGKTAEGLYKFGCWVQAQGQPGQTITITETRDDATYQGGVTMTTVDGDWANPIDWNNIGVTKPKVTKSADGKSATFTIPNELSGDHMARIRVVVVTPEKEMTNKATVNNKEVSTTATWRAKGSSGAETGENEKPVTPTPAPTPDPTPTPDPKPTPDQPKPDPTPEPDPKPSEPPMTPPVTPEDPKPAPTPEPSTPPAPVTPPVTPEPEKPAPTPDPTPDTPKPDPKPTPEQPTPNPDPKPTPEPSTPPVTPPTPEPEPSQPSTPEKPKPEPSKPSEPTDPAPTPDPKPSEPSVTPPATPEKPKPEKPAEKPEPKETPKETPSQPSTPATPDKPGNSTPEHKGAITGLAQTGASDTGLMIAGVTALVTAGGIALLLRRRQNNN